VTGALAHYLADALGRSQSPIEGIDGAAVSARNVLSKARAIARDLSAVAPGEPVLATIANAPVDFAAMLGIWLAGGVVVPVHANAGALAAEAVQQATGARLRVNLDRIESVSMGNPPAREHLRDAALIIFTSGSTAKPKGVVIGHDRMAAKLAVLDRLVRLTAQDTIVVPLRLTFIFGIWVSLLAVGSGARLVLVPKFTPEGLAQSLGPRGTVLAAVPTMLRGLLADGAIAAPTLRTILTGGETLGAALGGSLRAELPQAGVYDLYGLTETGSCDFCLPPAEHADGAGSIGRPTEQVAFRLIGEDGRPVPDGAQGELAIRTPFGMLGYLDDPTLTAGSFSDGYFLTGDLASERSDGRVEIVGRLKDIISRGGNKIAPAEIDALLCSHPDVAAALCAGVPDPRLGEAIHAVVVPRANAALTAEDLRRWAAERIERYKVPDAIYVRDALPVGSTGKVLRAGVAQLALAGASREGR
jgi:acyl-CoA synthetase (AMP-forming)/AMP-acid ligase II